VRSTRIDYVFGLAGNERLGRMTLPLHDKAQAQYQHRQESAREFRTLLPVGVTNQRVATSTLFPKSGISPCTTVPLTHGAVLDGSL